ncbi:MAG: DUF3131 domain-containing protein [Scytonematopsis contorta HA4267-MV1]|jgi:hypothetical protein|nr:DUF3131 domain-containing protein [Scytonematopsis contorta HA4267-MV1]
MIGELIVLYLHQNPYQNGLICEQRLCKQFIPVSVNFSGTQPSPKITLADDKIAAQSAWKYFERNWNSHTGFVNSVDGYTWTTLWDQGSAIMGIHAGYQLGLVPKARFNQMVKRLLLTLEKLPLPATRLPNKAYSTTTAQMRRLNNTSDPHGISGWSALDMARFLMGLYILRTHYPEYTQRVERIVSRWDLKKLVKDGWLYGGVPDTKGHIRYLQEGRLGYEQYAANSLKLWNLEASNALYNPPVKAINLDGISFQVDERNLKNSGASNYLTNDPYLLWGLELGWNEAVKPQVESLLKIQEQRYNRTGILTAVNEDSIDRHPYFLYYSIFNNGKMWLPITPTGKAYPNLRFTSTKAAFGWNALIPEHPYTIKLRDTAQKLTTKNRGYFAGKYENPKLGNNTAVDVNTNAIILESLLYKARNATPLQLNTGN